ncbi:hypothetical protein SB773_24205 [Bacillus sp. SIMBA_074]|uniref:class I SAM-dependent methyltransferase n=1 Tax=Bacillus sp. SIMBA_074 TaxID=3085812 RepID=UPI003978BA29
MKGTQMLALNKKCWDTVAPYFFQVDCLPKYGPYTASEDEIHLFDSIRNKKVLDIGCGSGHSLQYMAGNVQATLYKRKISTYINELNRVGFTIERIEEPEPSSSFDEELAEPSTKYYSLYKARMVPTTFIIKVRK